MNIFYLYSQPRKKWINAVKRGHMPNHSLYGLSHLSKRHHVYTTDVGFVPSNMWRWIASPIQRWFLSKTGVGFQIDQVIPLIHQINTNDVIITTNDSCGLPVAWLKQLGIIKTPQIYCHIGFSNQSNMVKTLLKQPEKVICFSSSETKKIPASTLIAPGVDVGFFRPQKTHPVIDTFSVGRDIHRDYTTLLIAASRLHLKTTIICDPKNIVGLPIPGNIHVKHHQTYLSVRKEYNQAKLVVIPVTKNSVSGQISLLEALACGKPTIVAKTPALEKTFGLVDQKHCLFYAPQNPHSLELQLKRLIKNTSLQRNLSKNARLKAKEFSSTKFSKTLMSVVEDVSAFQSSLH